MISNSVLIYLKKTSFTVYLYHMLVVTYITLAVVDLKINVYVKYLITVVVSFLVIVILYRILQVIKTKWGVIVGSIWRISRADD